MSSFDVKQTTHTRTHRWQRYLLAPSSKNRAIIHSHFYNWFICAKSARMWLRFCNASRLILSTVLRLHALKRNKQQEQRPPSSSRQPFWNQTAISNWQPHYWTLRTASSMFVFWGSSQRVGSEVTSLSSSLSISAPARNLFHFLPPPPLSAAQSLPWVALRQRGRTVVRSPHVIQNLHLSLKTCFLFLKIFLQSTNITFRAGKSGWGIVAASTVNNNLVFLYIF